MNERERLIATLLFQQPDKIPMITMGPRKSTVEAWRAQGMPASDSWFRALCSTLDIPYDFPRQPQVWPAVDFRMIPMFEEKVLEHKDGHYIVQDWMGNITEISDEYDYTYIRNAIDFVTRKWHKFPVESRADFAQMKTRYNPNDPARFAPDFREQCRTLTQRDYPMRLGFAGPFWQLREWCGFEPLCMLFMDDLAFVEEMTAFWSDFVAAVLTRALEHYVPDVVVINEDMAYKHACMIAPALVRRVLLPVWQRWGAIVKSAGVPVYDVDSDGCVDQLIPIWIEAGFDCNDPVEVAAGCDIVNYRALYGRNMAYTGGIDKRCMARGGADLDAEIERIAPVVRDGGYIPGCDHGIPPDVSWQNMLHFGRRWAELTGWL